MAEQEIIVTPHTLPAGYCFTTLQDLLDTFSAHQTVLLPEGSTQIIVSASTPAPADQDKVWLKLDGSGDPVNFYWFNLGSWKEVNPPNVFWGIASNVLNAYTTAVAKPPAALVTGQLFLFKVPTANTGASTLQVNAFGAFPFNTAGLAMTGGELVVNAYVGAIWSGTTFELFGAVGLINVAKLVPGANGQRVETTGGVVGWRGGWIQMATSSTLPVVITGFTAIGNHGLGAIPDLVCAYLECVSADQGYSAGDRIPLRSALTIDGGSNDKQAYHEVVDATQVGFVSSIYTDIIVPVKNTGAYTVSNITGSIAKWKISVNLFKF